jgi:hypothetical protein
MALDPRISMGVQPPNIPQFDLLGAMLTSARLREAQTLEEQRRQQMQEMQAELVRQERQREILREHEASLRGGGGGQPAAPAPSILQQELRPTSSANAPAVRQTEFRPVRQEAEQFGPPAPGTTFPGYGQTYRQEAEPFGPPAPAATAPVSQPAAPLASGVPTGGYLGPQKLGGGQTATALSQTVTDARINQGKPTNIPLIVPGISQQEIQSIAAGKEPSEEAYERSIAHAQSRIARGEQIPSYGTIDEAVSVSKAESEDRGTRLASAATTPSAPAQVTPLPGMRMTPRTTTQLAYKLLGNGASNAIQTVQAVDAAENAAVNRETVELAKADAGIKYLRNLSQVVHSQESLDLARAELDRRAPGMAQLLPPSYTAETWKAWQDRLTPLAERIEARKAQIEAAKFGLEVQKGGREERKTALEEARLPLEQAKSAREEEELKLKQRAEPAKATREITQQELALQKEYNDLTKPYRDVRDAMGRIEASAKNPTPAGDMSVVYAYMKLLDPQTGIRNEEVRNAETVGGLPAQANYWMQWIQGGARLPENVRNDFVSRAKMLYGQYTKDYEDVAEQYREQARRQKLDPANVVPEYRSRTVRETQAKKGTAANPVTRADIAEMINRKGGTEEEWRDALRRANKVVE